MKAEESASVSGEEVSPSEILTLQNDKKIFIVLKLHVFQDEFQIVEHGELRNATDLNGV